MNYKYSEATFLSENKKTTVLCHFYEPLDGDIKGVVQLSHGMCEYVTRYEPLAEYLCAHGYAFCGNDHLGHGGSVDSQDGLGFTSEGGGVDHIVADLKKMTDLAKERYEGLPLVLFGHSMGSFMARLYITRYASELCGAVICGTGGPESPAAAGKLVASLLMKFKGERHRSAFVDNMAFGSYNKKFASENDPKAWLSTDKSVREKYVKDPLCSYTFTLRGFYDLFDALDRVSRKSWAESVPKTLPIYLVAGGNDPVGNYGKGVRAVYDRLKEAGADVSIRLYQGARHEPHNESEPIRSEFLSDTLAVIEGFAKKGN